jgi:hypothetical protein
VLARIARVDVLVLDDFAVAPINDQERGRSISCACSRQAKCAQIHACSM